MSTVDPLNIPITAPVGETRDINVVITVDAGFTTAGVWELHWITDLKTGEIDCRLYDQTTSPQLAATIAGQVVTLSVSVPHEVTKLLEQKGTGRFKIEQYQAGINRRDAWVVGSITGTYGAHDAC